MRNSTRYIARKRWSEFAKDIKTVYRAVSLDEAVMLFEAFEQNGRKLPRLWLLFGERIGTLLSGYLSTQVK